MADSSTWLATLTASQAAKEVTANGLFDAASPAANFGRRAAATTGLTWAFYGGIIYVDGVRTKTSNGTVALTGSATNYVEVDRAGTVTKNTSAFTPGKCPLYKVVTGTSTISSYEDHRPPVIQFGGLQAGLKAVSMTADANKTLLITETMARILQFTSTVSLTATRDIILPLDAGAEWVVYNNTTGGRNLQFIGASGTGVTVASGMRAIIYADGTNIVRATPDV